MAGSRFDEVKIANMKKEAFRKLRALETRDMSSSVSPLKYEDYVSSSRSVHGRMTNYHPLKPASGKPSSISYKSRLHDAIEKEFLRSKTSPARLVRGSRITRVSYFLC